MSRDQNLGHAVVDGRVRYLSVSALAKADPREKGCFRRWYYRYVLGKSAEENEKGKKAKEAGEKLHSELEHYLKTGEKALSALALRGLHFVPDPRPPVIGDHGDITHKPRDLYVEFPMHVTTEQGVSSVLTAGGVPVIGFIDCFHFRGINKGASDPSEVYDPPNTVEIIDWKYKGNLVDRFGNSTLTPPERLIYTTQMAGYGEWFRRTQKVLKHVRLSHGVFPAKGGEPRKITKLHVIDDCARTWEYVEGVARSIVDVARETDVNKVPANLMACESYGGCPHREYCTAAQNNSLSNLFGETAAQEIQKDIMGLLEQVETPQLQQTLADEEARLRAQQQQIMQQPLAQPQGAAGAVMAPSMLPAPQPMLPPLPEPVTTPQVAAPPRADGTLIAVQPDPASVALLQTWQGICAYATANHPTYNEMMGVPALGGPAAAALARAKGFALEGSGLSGTGVLGRSMTIFDVAQLDALLGELKAKIALPAQNVVSSGTGVGPNTNQVFAPAPAPVLGALTPQANPAPIPGPSPSAPLPSNVPMMLPPEAPANNPALAAKPLDQPQQQVQAPPAPPKKKRGRPPANPPSAPQPSALAGTPGSPIAGAPTQGADGGLQSSGADEGTPDVYNGTFEVYIDCIPNVPYVSLAGYIQKINLVLSNKFCVAPDGRKLTQDVRCAPKDTPLAYGGWEGAVYEIVTTTPPPDGVWFLETGSKLNQIVAEALEVVCLNRGSLFVKGLR